MAKQRIQPRNNREEEDDDRHESRPVKARGSSRLFWLGSRLFVVLMLLAGLAFFAPLLISRTGLWKTILAVASPELAGKIDAGSLQLSWLTPIEIRNLAVRDAAGQPLAAAVLIRSHKTLLELALNSRDLGQFEVQDLAAKIVLRADGSNIEDFLAKLPQQPQSKSSGGTQVSLQLVRGAVDFDDQIAGRQWQLHDVTVDLAWTAAADQPKTGKLAAALRPAGNVPGAASSQLAAEFSWQPGQGEQPGLGTGKANVSLQGFPTEIVEGAARRFALDVRPRGPLTVQGGYAWAAEGKSQHIIIQQLATSGLSVHAPTLLGADQPTLAINEGQADVQIEGGQATIRDLRLVSNLLQVAGKGSVAVGGLSDRSPYAPREGIVSRSETPTVAGDVEVRGQVDLAEMCRQLPATLRLKPDTQLTSGVVQVSLVGRAAADGRQWQGSLATDRLQATSAGRPIVFDKPLKVDFAVRQTTQGPVIDQLVGEANFLHLKGHGALAEGGVAAGADLNQLSAELGQLIDWGNTKLAGTLATEIRWKQGADASSIAATADTQVQNFELSSPGLAPWKEPALRLLVDARGTLLNSGLDRIDNAKLTVEAGPDRLDAELTQPVKSPSAAAIWPVKFTLHGDLATWTPRLQPFMPLGSLRVAGAIDLAGAGKLSVQTSELAETTLRIKQLAVEASGLSVREPTVELQTSAAWDQEKMALTLGSTTFASSALAFRADGLRVALGKEPSVVGQIDYRGDLSKLSTWLGGGPAGTWQLAGGVTGRAEIGYRGQTLAANWSSDVENLAYLTAPPPRGGQGRPALASAPAAAFDLLWQEPRVNFAGQGTFDPANSTLKIDRTSLATANASLAAAGAVGKLATAPEVDLAGEIAYDLSLVTQQIQTLAQRQVPAGKRELPYGLGTFQLTGKEKRQFVLKGPLLAMTGDLTPAQSRDQSSRNNLPPTQPTSATNGRGFAIADALAGEASLGWQGAQYVGLVAGPADFRARLAGGIVQVGPLDIPLSEGRLTTAPRLLLNNAVPQVVVERGPLIQNVRISPEMCSLWLKFVAPLVADATRAEGTFSLSLQGAALPLSDPLAGDVAGTLAIQQAQIGPGPLAQQYLGMANQLRSFIEPGAQAGDPNRGWLILPQQDVTFEVKDGAVHHRGLKMTVKDIVITTEGSVGIENQQINLLASIPVQESWLKKPGSTLAGLKGQTIQIPIRGTLTQPKLDGKILENLGKQVLGSAVQGQVDKQVQRGQDLLQKELGQGLNKLFGPLQPQQPAPAVPRK